MPPRSSHYMVVVELVLERGARSLRGEVEQQSLVEDLVDVGIAVARGRVSVEVVRKAPPNHLQIMMALGKDLPYLPSRDLMVYI